jgi:hypothetical protein
MSTVKKKHEIIAKMLTSVQSGKAEIIPIYYYPFGNTRSRNVLQDFNCEAGGFNPCDSSLKVTNSRVIFLIDN